MIKIDQSRVGIGGKARVTFSMPAIDGCTRLYLVGWFTEWDETVYEMESTPDGGWYVTLELEPGCTYQYRFRTLDGTWLSDPAERPASTRFGLNRSFLISRSALAQSPTRPRAAPSS